MYVLLVESDRKSGEELQQNLRRNGYETKVVNSGADAVKVYDEFDLVLLDLDIPDIDGLEVCRSIREFSLVPIIAFTRTSAEIDRVLCLQAGCDDCLAKPYGLRELVARMEAVMRRVRPPATASALTEYGPLRIDRESWEAYLNDEPLKLTRKEFDLLQLLASQPSMVFSREQLMTRVWGAPKARGSLGVNLTRTIDTHVSSLRSKLGSSEWVITVRGVGFRFGG